MANFKSLFSTRPAFPKLQFEAEATDGSLSHLLSEAFAVIERRFGMLDKDGAGMMMYAALEGQLSLTGFNDNEKLRKIFQKVSSCTCQHNPRAAPQPAPDLLNASQLRSRAPPLTCNPYPTSDP